MLVKLVVVLAALAAAGYGALFHYPRPPDTTAAGVFAGDGAELDYCVLPELGGPGLAAADIPKAFTPGCGWERWPMPVLAGCTEPLAEGVVDMRGLWRGPTASGGDHIERIEQCGNRTVVTSGGVIHDFLADGTLANGARDIEPPSCVNVWIAIEWEDGVQNYRPLGLPYTIVTRERRGATLVWRHPVYGESTLRRICAVPPERRRRGAEPAGLGTHASKLL